MSHCCDVLDARFLSPQSYKDYDLIVLGPGPGAVGDYVQYFDEIQKLINSQKRVLGICLGHQLVHRLIGRKVEQLENPVHGQSKYVLFEPHNILQKELQSRRIDCQFYNSWRVKFSECSIFSYEVVDEEGSVIASFSDNLVTYQFHPESVGTSFQSLLLRQVLV